MRVERGKGGKDRNVPLTPDLRSVLRGWLDESAVVRESLIAIRRAGADVILTYFARQFAEELAGVRKK